MSSIEIESYFHRNIRERSQDMPIWCAKLLKFPSNKTFCVTPEVLIFVFYNRTGKDKKLKKSRSSTFLLQKQSLSRFYFFGTERYNSNKKCKICWQAEDSKTIPCCTGWQTETERKIQRELLEHDGLTLTGSLQGACWWDDQDW